MNRNNTSIVQAMQWATRILQESGIENSRLDAEVLLTHCINRTRENLYVNYSLLLDEKEWELYVNSIERRAQREPVAYITGRKEFRMLNFTVTPDVLIPRPETETLVDTLLQKCRLLQRKKAHLKILELGTGSGIISISLAREINNSRIIATDIAFDKIALARENARVHGLDDVINFCVGDLTHALKLRNSTYRFDCIVFNPPYLAEADWSNVQPEILHYEPRDALCGGSDGLTFYRKLLTNIDLLLQDGGFILLEIGSGQAVSVTDIIQKTTGYSDLRVVQDLAGMDRVISARKERPYLKP